MGPHGGVGVRPGQSPGPKLSGSGGLGSSLRSALAGCGALCRYTHRMLSRNLIVLEKKKMVTGKPAWSYCTGENSGVQGPKDLPALQIRGSLLSSRGAGWRPVDRAHLERGWVLLSGDPATSLNPLTEFCDSHNLGFFFLFFFAGLHCWGFLEKSCVWLRIESWLCMDGLCVPEYNGFCTAHKAVHRP